MLRSLVIVGTTAAISAAVPIAYRSNPAVFESLLGMSEPAPRVEAVSQRPRGSQPALPDPAFDGRKVRIAADERGHYVAEFRMNGQRVDGMVDTGATTVAINRSTARRLGLNLTQADFVHEVGTANGRARAAAAVLREIEIGRIRVRNVEVAVLEDRALSGTLVGMSFLGKLRRFESGSGELLLEQ